MGYLDGAMENVGYIGGLRRLCETWAINESWNGDIRVDGLLSGVHGGPRVTSNLTAAGLAITNSIC